MALLLLVAVTRWCGTRLSQLRQHLHSFNFLPVLQLDQFREIHAPTAVHVHLSFPSTGGFIGMLQQGQPWMQTTQVRAIRHSMHVPLLLMHSTGLVLCKICAFKQSFATRSALSKRL
jgi:hypothetical protein